MFTRIQTLSSTNGPCLGKWWSKEKWTPDRSLPLEISTTADYLLRPSLTDCVYKNTDLVLYKWTKILLIYSKISLKCKSHASLKYLIYFNYWVYMMIFTFLLRAYQSSSLKWDLLQSRGSFTFWAALSRSGSTLLCIDLSLVILKKEVAIMA